MGNFIEAWTSTVNIVKLKLPWYPLNPALASPVALAIDHLPSVAVGVAGARRLDVGADAGDLVTGQNIRKTWDFATEKMGI